MRVKDMDAKDLNIMIVGNKSDLETERQVTTSEGQAVANRYGSLFLEASAKTRSNVNEVFEGIARLYRQRALAGLGIK